ncbi:hypothetical protein ACLOJK_027538 [Asimina triloba]
MVAKFLRRFQKALFFFFKGMLMTFEPSSSSAAAAALEASPRQPTVPSSSSSSSGVGLEACLNLLRGGRDEQRLAGLLLVTKFCHNNDTGSILQIYEAVGTRFLDRLLMTGNSAIPPLLQLPSNG